MERNERLLRTRFLTDNYRFFLILGYSRRPFAGCFFISIALSCIPPVSCIALKSNRSYVYLVRDLVEIEQQNFSHVIANGGGFYFPLLKNVVQDKRSVSCNTLRGMVSTVPPFLKATNRRIGKCRALSARKSGLSFYRPGSCSNLFFCNFRY